VKVSVALADATGGPKPETVVKIVSDAELGGVLEDFAKTGGIAVANVIMADFARRASEEFSRDEVAPEVETAPVEAAPLAAQALLWVVIKAYCVRLRRAVGLAR
jgi:hypothetical protein